MSPLTWTLVCFVVMMIGFILNKWIPFALTGFATIVLLSVGGVMDIGQSLTFLADSSVIMIGATFVVAAALMKTNVVHRIVNLMGFLGHSERGLITGFSIITAILVQIVQPPVALSLLTPLIYSACKEYHIAPTRVILPVGFTAIVWVGMIPIAHGAAAWTRYEGLLQTMGMEGMGAFDLMLPRIPGCVLSMVFVNLVGYRLCPMEAKGKIELPTQVQQEHSIPAWKTYATYVIFLLVSLGMFTSSYTGLDSTLIACVGAALVAAFGIMDEKEIYRSLPLGMMLMLAGTLAIASAVTISGADEIISGWLVTIVGENAGELRLTLVFFLVPFVLTQFMSNTAVDSMFSPLLLLTCSALELNPIPFLSALRVAGACSVLTPMATITVPIMMLCGGYRLSDVVKFSLPPMLIVAVSSIVYTLVWL